MPVYDVPITTDDTNLKKVLNAGLPVVLYLFNQPDATLDAAIRHVAKEYAGKLLVARVDATANAHTFSQYGSPTLPALLTIRENAVKSQANAVQPFAVNEHVRYLLGEGALPKDVHQPAAANQVNVKPITVSDSSFKADVLESSVPVLVDFWAPWCGPCHAVAPSLEQIAQQFAGQMKVAKLNVDDNPRMSRQYQATSIPLLLMFKNGKVVGRLLGAHPKPNIEQLVQKHL
jgi:thioredoxin 1